MSAFYVDCPERGVVARGFDQISAKFTGTSIRVTPGQHNLGIFLSLRNRGGEEYKLTHPAAHLGGLLRGSLSITVADTCTITCLKTRIKAILQYLEEPWLGRAQHRMIGVIFKYDPINDNKEKIKDVPEGDILARIEGCWHDKIYYTLTGSTNKTQLIDVSPLFPIPKEVPPEEEQLPNESRKYWSGVTNAIKSKQYSLATKLKYDLEEGQRQKVLARKEKNEQWRPRFFKETVTELGKPDLTIEGQNMLDQLHNSHYYLDNPCPKARNSTI